MKARIMLVLLLWVASPLAWAVEAGTGSPADSQATSNGDTAENKESLWQEFLDAMSDVFADK